MKSGFYAGRTALNAQQQAMDTLGNNIANVNTNGYLRQGVSFQNLLKAEMYVSATSKPLAGHGVKAVSTGLTVGTGTLKATGGILDFAIPGEGFFAIENENGDVEYTRDGTFDLTLDGDDVYLATPDGRFVLDTDEERIEIEKVKSKDNDKETASYDYDALTEKIGVFVFQRPSALSPVSGNRYVATEASGEAEEVEEPKLLKGFLESSTVSITDEMANLITVQRAFQISARVVQTFDENEQTINGLRG